MTDVLSPENRRTLMKLAGAFGQYLGGLLHERITRPISHRQLRRERRKRRRFHRRLGREFRRPPRGIEP